MNRRELLHQLGWDDKLIDFYMVSDDDVEEQMCNVTYTMNDDDNTTLPLGISYSCTTIQLNR